MVEQTIADYDNTFSLRPNRLDGCYIFNLLLSSGVKSSQQRWPLSFAEGSTITDGASEIYTINLR